MPEAVLKSSLHCVLWSAIVVGCVRVPLLIWWTIRDIGIGLNWFVLRKVAAFGAPLVLSNLAIFILNYSDHFFLQWAPIAGRRRGLCRRAQVRVSFEFHVHSVIQYDLAGPLVFP